MLKDKIASDQPRACAAYSIETIRAIIERFGPRPPGSEGERQCQEFLRDEMAQVGLHPTLEPFTVAQKGFMAMPAVCAILALCALPLYWWAPRFAPIPVLLALAVCVCELLLYKHVLTPFFPKSTSYNLWAALPPSGTLQRRLILCGHADAAFEWNFLRWFPRIFPFFPVLILLSVAYVLLTSLGVALFGASTAEGFWRWLGLSQLLALPGLGCGLFFTNFDMVSPGAGDNLTGALIATAMARLMKENNLALEHTELVFLVTGSEEAGLEGARAFLAAHQHEWADAPTSCIAFDTICEPEHLAVYVRDLNSLVRHDPALCRLIQDAGRDCGLNLPESNVPLGASDAAAFAQAGVSAAAVCAMDHAPAHYYHNRRDDLEALSAECLEQTFQLTMAVCDYFDQKGLTS